MTGERTYPRKWYSVSGWGDIHEREFIGETEHRLREPDRMGSKRFVNKVTQWHKWYPTREEAEQAAEDAKANTSAAVALRRKESAAEELYEALADLCSFETELTQEKWDKARAALAKARGEA